MPHRPQLAGRSMEQSPPAVLLQDVKKSFPLGHGHALRCSTLPPWRCRWKSHGPQRSQRFGENHPAEPHCWHCLTSGLIQVNGTDLVPLPEPQRDRFRAAHIGYIFQTFNLLAPFTALENVMLAMRFANTIPRRAQRQRAVISSHNLASRRVSPTDRRSSHGASSSVWRWHVPWPMIRLYCSPMSPAPAWMRPRRRWCCWPCSICREHATTVLIVAHDTAALAGADQVLDMQEINRATGQPDDVERA